MQYSAYDAQQAYGTAPDVSPVVEELNRQNYDGQQGYAIYSPQVTLSVAEFSGVTGFAGSSSYLPAGLYCPIYGRYGYLPYTLRNGEEQVLSRWHMKKQKLTVSRKQCQLAVAADGTATLTSTGRGPTMVRTWSGADGVHGPWNALYKDTVHVLGDGDQIGLDCDDPDSAVFTCHVEGDSQHLGGAYAQHGDYNYAQHDYTEDEQHGSYAQALPDGWATAVDEASGSIYYYHAQTGQSQWELPL